MTLTAVEVPFQLGDAENALTFKVRQIAQVEGELPLGFLLPIQLRLFETCVFLSRWVR